MELGSGRLPNPPILAFAFLHQRPPQSVAARMRVWPVAALPARDTDHVLSKIAGTQWRLPWRRT
jgi:hypothetical protein